MKSKKVNQYSKEGKLIASFKSATEASKKTGCDYSSITKACNFKVDYVKGFRFEFENDEFTESEPL
jgi:hypothetical protein